MLRLLLRENMLNLKERALRAPQVLEFELDRVFLIIAAIPVQRREPRR